MGSYISKGMSESMEKNQKSMMDNQRAMMLKQREMQMATQLAMARDNFKWFSAFYATAGLGMLRGFSHSKNPAFIAPLVPLTFLLAFQYDMAQGYKMDRIREEADRILQNESGLFALPEHNRLISTKEYDELFPSKSSAK